MQAEKKAEKRQKEAAKPKPIVEENTEKEEEESTEMPVHSQPSISNIVLSGKVGHVACLDDVTKSMDVKQMKESMIHKAVSTLCCSSLCSSLLIYIIVHFRKLKQQIKSLQC